MGRQTETTFLYCMNDQCRARLIRVDMLHPIGNYGELPPLGIPVQQGWCVRDAFDFENVAFSRRRESASNTNFGEQQSPLRYLCCGECDWGPIGYAILEDRPRPLIIIDQNKVAQ